MPLNIQTFSNVTGGATLFKALGHPLTVDKVRALYATLAARGRVAVYDPWGQFEPLIEFFPIDKLEIVGVYVQDIEKIGRAIAGRVTRPVTEIMDRLPQAILVAAFDAEGLIYHIDRMADAGVEFSSLDDLRLPEEMITRSGRYLDPLNFATNFAFFRDSDGQHTRIVTVNYWRRYGGRGLKIWARLFGRDGETLAEWTDPVPDGDVSLCIDSADVRARFGLAPFEGQLFLHVIGATGHDVVKYALDIYGDRPDVLSCTHDANAWPADLYAGLPAPRDGEEVILWIQNSHPCPIPVNGIGLNRMGDENVAWLTCALSPFASSPINVSDVLPDLESPQQIEIRAGKYFVRPRYEIRKANGRMRMAHANVERTDLEPDAKIKSFGNLMGRGFVLPAPILPLDRFSVALLPTPMSTCQTTLPVGVALFDATGEERCYHSLGCLARGGCVWLEIDELLKENGKLNGALGSGSGHIELMYDFSDGGDADGWLHAIFRYEDRVSGHAAETSFGAHIFNHILTYRNEPQSYNGPSPGLSTRLFLRLGDSPLDTMCHLINPVAADWGRVGAEAELHLHSAAGLLVTTKIIKVPASGSVHWRYSETFNAVERQEAGDGAYIIVRALKQRLFGYHGLLNGRAAFSLDHMFGF